jgi:hypothetical protein
MRDLKIIILIISILICSEMISQNNHGKKKDPLGFFAVGYRMPLNHNPVINSGHGLFIEGGLNLFKNKLKKVQLSVIAGWAFQDRLWNTKFNERFAEDYTNSISTENVPADSGCIHLSQYLISNASGNAATPPGCSTNSFHNYSMYLGFELHFKSKYFNGLKLYRGTTRTYIMSDYKTRMAQEFNVFEIRRPMYGAEVTITRFLLKQRNSISLNVYSEYNNFTNSVLHFYDGSSVRNISLRKIAKSSFIDKYRFDAYFGFKCSFNFNH